MKKTIIALAITGIVATAANAQPIYDNGTTKVDVDGRVSVQLRNYKQEAYGEDITGNKHTDFIDEDSRVRVRAWQKITEELEAIYAAEIRFSTAGKTFNDIHIKRFFGGFHYKPLGQLTFGRQLTNGDPLGAASFSYELGSIVKVTDAHNKAFSFISRDFDGFRLGLDYLIGDSTGRNSYTYTTTTTQDDGTSVETTNTGYYDDVDTGSGFNVVGFYDKKFGDVRVIVEAGYGQLSNSKEANAGTANYSIEKYNKKLWGAGIGLRFPKFGIGFDYAGARSPEGQKDHTFRVGSAKFEHLDQFDLGLKYQLTPKNAVYGQFLFGNAKNVGEETAKFSGYFLGVDHVVNHHVVFYVEGGKFKTKQGGTEVNNTSNIALGTRILF